VGFGIRVRLLQSRLILGLGFRVALKLWLCPGEISAMVVFRGGANVGDRCLGGANVLQSWWSGHAVEPSRAGYVQSCRMTWPLTSLHLMSILSRFFTGLTVPAVIQAQFACRIDGNLRCADDSQHAFDLPRRRCVPQRWEGGGDGRARRCEDGRASDRTTSA